MNAIRPRLLILGTGFASFSLVKAIDVDSYEVIIVSPRNHFLFTPLLPSTTVGTIEFRSIIEPIRTARRNIRFHQARCVRLDLENNIAHCEGFFRNTPFQLEYDLLVIGVGMVSNTFGVPGVDQHAFFMKELADARAIRQRIIECFERASKPKRDLDEVRMLLHFVVVGGGPTGVEFAAEMHDFARQDLSRWFPDLMPYVKITLLEARNDILSAFDVKLSKYALRHFRRGGVHVRTGCQVAEVQENAVVLNTGENTPCGLVVWSTGIAANDLVRSIDVPKGPLQRLVTDRDFLVVGTRNVYAIGDCSILADQDLPATAQVAQQQGKHLAKHLNRKARRMPTKPFRYRHMGMLAYIGE
ncbi:MAG TPA: FAD-dependent oxidoreductase, partial [Candidatus Hydrogenedentes bacterium]|nr:FAD-dependent oxidoreductase [Candidatus Hydrogenedentota bacterium]